MSKINLLAPVCAEDFDDLGNKNSGREIIAALNIIKHCEKNGLDFHALSEHLSRLRNCGFISYLPNRQQEDD